MPLQQKLLMQQKCCYFLYLKENIMRNEINHGLAIDDFLQQNFPIPKKPLQNQLFVKKKICAKNYEQQEKLRRRRSRPRIAW